MIRWARHFAGRSSVGLIRVHFRQGGLRRSRILGKIARAVAAMTRENVRTNRDGEWEPVQYGPRAGLPALVSWAEDWVSRWVSLGKWIVRPKAHQKAWRGHVGGKLIRPKRKRALRFPDGVGGIVFARRVQLPKRDPRPTREQLDRVFTRFIGR